MGFYSDVLFQDRMHCVTLIASLHLRECAHRNDLSGNGKALCLMCCFDYQQWEKRSLHMALWR